MQYCIDYLQSKKLFFYRVQNLSKPRIYQNLENILGLSGKNLGWAVFYT